MSKRSLSILLAPWLLLAGCTRGDRGLETVHQPIVDSHQAHVNGCPDWSDAGKPIGEGQSSNFGCASSTNLAAMIADPADLLRGRSDDGATDFATRAVKAWREAVPTSKSWGAATKESAGGPK